MIINTATQYNELVNKINRETHLSLPIFSDAYQHNCINVKLCVAYMFLDGSTYILSVSHDDAPNFPYVESKYTLTEDVLRSMAYMQHTSIPSIQHYYAPYVHDTLRMFDIEYSHTIIPLMVWSSIVKQYGKALLSVYKPITPEIECVIRDTRTLRQIETSGIQVNKEIFEQHYEEKALKYIHNGKVYSQYNPYTTTGRPSNRFGGINFAAINKNDGSRDAFISRYDDGVLVQIDFEAYHLRLIANEMKIDLPKTSIHTELAKLYFNTNNITEELYAKSKQKTFEIMYGQTDETYNFELFEKIHQLRNSYAHKTSITLPNGLVVTIDEPSSNKLYNYYVQSLETVKTIPKLQQILDLLESTSSHLVLYTYDSVLLDMKEYDVELLKHIVDLLEENKKFPVRVYKGTTYGNIMETRL